MVQGRLCLRLAKQYEQESEEMKKSEGKAAAVRRILASSCPLFGLICSALSPNRWRGWNAEPQIPYTEHQALDLGGALLPDWVALSALKPALHALRIPIPLCKAMCKRSGITIALFENVYLESGFYNFFTFAANPIP